MYVIDFLYLILLIMFTEYFLSKKKKKKHYYDPLTIIRKTERLARFQNKN